MFLGLSSSDYEYLHKENSFVPDLSAAEPLQNDTLYNEYGASLTSGKSTTNPNPKSLQTPEQNHFVQSPVNVVANTATNLAIVSLSNENTINIDSGFVSSPIGSSTVTLSSALKGLNLVSNIPSDDNQNPLLPGQFQIIGHTGAADANGVTDLQILDVNGQQIQVPVQLVRNPETDECAIHFLSLEVESDVTPNADVKNDATLLIKHEKKVETSGEDLSTLRFEEPNHTSTPAIHMNGLNDTILAGNLTTKPVHGPTPDPVEDMSTQTPMVDEMNTALQTQREDPAPKNVIKKLKPLKRQMTLSHAKIPRFLLQL